ncbi:class I SAM-dependent methyltransferase [Aeromicrobium sp. CTD01-1L150]|uniref:class I SAM-dependent methyltransferase n=1 Tax=Aeromicrobium sp. CTD01-1L150 TaxID=3341830 RepID=UPI0035C17363
MGPVRGEVMWQAVLDAVALVPREGPLDVLDLGGGTGGDSVRLASQGHRVTVVDPSPDALASLHRRAVDAGIPADSVVGLQGDANDLASAVAGGSQDLVLCHGVLEHVDDPCEALRAVGPVLRPHGRVSAVVAGRSAAVLARALTGDFDGARHMNSRRAATWDLRADGPRRFVPEELQAVLQEAGFEPVESAALRVFVDLVPSAVVDIEPGARERLYALEREVRGSSDFSGISAGLQTVARLDLEQTSIDRGDHRAAV